MVLSGLWEACDSDICVEKKGNKRER